jgi:hypothetical protein
VVAHVKTLPHQTGNVNLNSQQARQSRRRPKLKTAGRFQPAARFKF